MDCEGRYDEISMYIDGLLDEKSKRDLENHLKKCEVCQSIYKDYEDISKTLQGMFEETKIDIEYEVTEEIYQSQNKKRRYFQIASLIIFLVVGFFIGTFNTGNQKRIISKKEVLNEVNDAANNGDEKLLKENIKGRYEKVGF